MSTISTGSGVSAEVQRKILRENARRFFLNYFKAAARAFPVAFAGRKYAIRTATSRCSMSPGYPRRR